MSLKIGPTVSSHRRSYAQTERANANAKAKIFFDLCRLFFDRFSLFFYLFSLSLPLSLGVNRPLQEIPAPGPQVEGYQNETKLASNMPNRIINFAHCE